MWFRSRDEMGRRRISRVVYASSRWSLGSQGKRSEKCFSKLRDRLDAGSEVMMCTRPVTSAFTQWSISIWQNGHSESCISACQKPF